MRSSPCHTMGDGSRADAVFGRASLEKAPLGMRSVGFGAKAKNLMVHGRDKVSHASGWGGGNMKNAEQTGRNER